MTARPAYPLFYCGGHVPYSTQSPKDEITYCCDDRRFARKPVTARAIGRSDRAANHAFAFAEAAWLLVEALFYRRALYPYAR